MPCSQALDALVASVDTPLDAATQRAVDAHLLDCPRCVEALREHVLAREALRDAALRAPPEPPLPDETVRRIAAAMRAARTSPAGGAQTA